MKPADLRPGHRIAHTVPNEGTLTVFRDPWDDTEAATHSGWPDLARVYVDVEVSDRSSRWDPETLPAGAGATDFQWMGMTPSLRYRLVFLPDADIAVEAEI